MVQCRQTNLITHLVSEQGTEIQQHSRYRKGISLLLQKPSYEPPIDRSPGIDSILKHIPKEVTKE
jgi:hypothetical protein